MKVIGIIAEYNPFHLGHLYQINKIRERYPEAILITVISGHYTERGEISVINKWDKANLALKYGIDLVVELPTLYSTQSADIFASTALKILNNLKIDTLVFGSELDDIDTLKLLADTQLNNKEYNNIVKDYLDKGINYPTAMSKALYDITNIMIDKPNDLLGLSYIKEILKNNYKIEPISIKRTNDYHGKEINSNIINASLIRELINNNQDISKYVPRETLKYINNISSDKVFNYLKYNIITNKDILDEYLDVDEGIESRIIKNINNVSNLEELVKAIKTKRYTYNKINRMLLHILLSIKKVDNNQDIYIRVLGFNNKGKAYLNKIKKEITLPFITTYKPNINKTLDMEIKCSNIYSLIINNDNIMKKEYQNKPIIYE